MEKSFDIKAKVKQGDLSDAPIGKQPNTPSINIDLKKHAPCKYEADVALKDMNYPSPSGSEHVQDSFFKLADEKDY